MAPLLVALPAQQAEKPILLVDSRHFRLKRERTQSNGSMVWPRKICQINGKTHRPKKTPQQLHCEARTGRQCQTSSCTPSCGILFLNYGQQACQYFLWQSSLLLLLNRSQLIVREGQRIASFFVTPVELNVHVMIRRCCRQIRFRTEKIPSRAI